MPVDKAKINKFVSLALLVVLGIFGLVLLLQLAAVFFGPSKSACSKQVCLSRFLEGPPAFNNEVLSTYLRSNYYTPPASGEYKLSGINGRDEKFNNIVSFIKDFFKNKRGGTFVDLGAGDGEYKSLSLELEQSLGWTGLLIEPHEELYKRLLKKGRKSQSAKVCISPFAYPTKLKFGHPATTGFQEEEQVMTMGKNKMKQLIDNPTNIEVGESQCMPLENLIYSAGITTPFDLLVLDMAGTDLDVLISAKLEQIPEFEMIVLHSNGASIGNDVSGYFLERNMVVKKVFGDNPTEVTYVLVKFDAKRDL